VKQLRPGDRNFRGRQVRLIDQNNQQVGIVTFENAITKAQQAGLDLVLVPTRNDQMPVTRIMDFGKYQFDEAKREREAKRAQAQPKLKELKLHTNIDDNDFNIKVKHATEFLVHGDKVRLLLTYRGREMAHQELGTEVLNRFIKAVEPISVMDAPPKKMGKSVSTVLSVKPQFRQARNSAAKPGKDKRRDNQEQAAPAAESEE
jgi:translation initiation factor IF-3